jgi:hypothetical protein
MTGARRGPLGRQRTKPIERLTESTNHPADQLTTDNNRRITSDPSDKVTLANTVGVVEQQGNGAKWGNANDFTLSAAETGGDLDVFANTQRKAPDLNLRT